MVLLYGAVVAIIIGFYVWGLVKLLLTVRHCTRQVNNGSIILLNSGYGPGSLGKYIFFPAEEVDPVIQSHEEAHIKLGHSYDVLLVSLLQAICWPNILLYWIKKELKEVHEFQADRMVDADRDSYAQLILSATFNTLTITLMHSFLKHPIKRRIMMLRKNGAGSPLKATMQVAAAVLLLSSVAVIAQTKKAKPATIPGSVTISQAQKFEYLSFSQYKGQNAEQHTSRIILGYSTTLHLSNDQINATKVAIEKGYTDLPKNEFYDRIKSASDYYVVAGMELHYRLSESMKTILNADQYSIFRKMINRPEDDFSISN